MISDLVEIEIGGMKQSILVKGDNIENPLILILHGGPGAPLMPFAHKFTRLEEEFLVVYWDQRGAGKSYSDEIPSDTMTFQRILQDTQEVIQFLKDEYKKERIFLAGHSWGSLLGIYTAYQYPSDIYAYIGISQVVDYVKGNKISYQFALKTAEERNLTEIIEKLREIGEPPYKNKSGVPKVSLLSSYIFQFGGAFHIPIDMDSMIQNSEVYSPSDIKNINKGMEFSAIHLFEEILWANLIEEGKVKFDIPMVFLFGKYDYLVPSEVTVEYVESIKAPSKEIVWFNNSAHFCHLEETEHFIETLIQAKKKYY